MSEMKMSDWFKNKITLFGDTIEDNEFAYAVMSCKYEVDGVDAGVAICHAVNNHDCLTEENQKLREALTGLLECKGILTSDKDCVIKAKQLLEQTK